MLVGLHYLILHFNQLCWLNGSLNKSNIFVLDIVVELSMDMWILQTWNLQSPHLRETHTTPPLWYAHWCVRRGGRAVTRGNKQPADSRALSGNHPLSARTVEHPAAWIRADTGVTPWPAQRCHSSGRCHLVSSDNSTATMKQLIPFDLFQNCQISQLSLSYV